MFNSTVIKVLSGILKLGASALLAYLANSNFKTVSKEVVEEAITHAKSIKNHYS